MCVIGSLQASSVEIIKEGEPFEWPVKCLAGTKFTFSPDGDELKTLIIDMNQDDEKTISFLVKDSESLDNRIEDINATEGKCKTGKNSSIYEERKNFKLYGEGNVCHLIAESVTLKDVLFIPTPEVKILSIAFKQSTIRLKLTPINPELPFWITGTFDTQTFEEEPRSYLTQKSSQIKTFEYLNIISPIKIINASVEVTFSARL